MVGNESSGKTTFSAAVCKKLIEDTVEGIQLVPVRVRQSGISDEPETLFEEQTITYEYKSNLRLLESRRWPDGTGETVEWNLELLFHGRKIATIAWVDYRGGIVGNPNLDPTAPELYATIYNSESIIFFVDAYELTKHENDPGQGDASSGAQRIRELILSFTRKTDYTVRSSHRSSQRLIFLIALSKADAVSRKYRRNYPALVNRAKSAFNSLRPILERQKEWHAGVIPISSVGENVVVMDEEEAVNGKPRITSHINPINVELAMFYCIWQYLRIFADDEKLAEKIRAHTALFKRNPVFENNNDYQVARDMLEVIGILERIVNREVKSLL
jgi:hypothetical protein